jgi:hypothetical protein
MPKETGTANNPVNIAAGTTAIAILTYRRAQALRTFMTSLREHCPGYPVAVFEDMGNVDDTRRWLTQSAAFKEHDAELEADRWEAFDYTAFLGTRNVGVSGNSNRAIRWFLRDMPGFDHLCLCNDDLEAKGDWPAVYADAHRFFPALGLFCFSDWFDDESKFVPIRERGRVLRFLPVRKGAMMSITRKLLDRIGYFDAETFGKFGDEHNDFTNRAAQAGFMTVRGQPQHCLDVPCDLLAHQEAQPSISPIEKPALDRESASALSIASGRYPFTEPCRPFTLGGYSRMAGAYAGAGIHMYSLRRMNYDAVVHGWVPDLF